MRLASPFHPHHIRLILISGALCGIIGFFSAALWVWGPPQLPLWYSLVTPAEQLAPKHFLAALPGLSAVTLLITLWFGRKTQLEHEQYLALLSLWTGIFLQAFLLIGLVRIMKIVL